MTLQPGYFPPVKPPDPEWLSNAFLTQVFAAVGSTPAVPVVTELPSPEHWQATLPAIIRVEAGDTHFIKSLWGAAWDVDFLIHSYSPDEDEAADHSGTALGWCAAATGMSVVGWYIVDVIHVIGGRRLVDPEVPANIVRYRSAITWRVAGHPITT